MGLIVYFPDNYEKNICFWRKASVVQNATSAPPGELYILSNTCGVLYHVEGTYYTKATQAKKHSVEGLWAHNKKILRKVTNCKP